MSRRWFVLVPLVFGLLCGGLVDTQAARHASHGKKHSQKAPTVSTVTLDGTVEAIGKMGFQVNASKKQTGKKKSGKNKTPTKEWFIVPTKATTWHILGSADVNYLKPGQTIIFKTTLDGQSQPEDKVSILTVVPAKGNIPSIKADDGLGPIGRFRPKDPGIVEAAAPEKPAKKEAAAPPVVSGSVQVVGRIASCGRTKMTVRAGKELHVELDENPTINIALSDPKMMTVGAKVTIHGTATETKNASYCVPDEVTVTLATPLTGKEKPSELDPPEKAEIPVEATSPESSSSDDKPKDADAPDEKAAPGKAAGDKLPAEVK